MLWPRKGLQSSSPFSQTNSLSGAPSRDWEDSDHTWDSKYTILHATPTRMHSKGVVLACSPIDAALVATAGGDDRRFLRKIGQGDWAFELQGICMTLKLVMD
ncbi:hypothetical protein glysoja_017947 [Glycine soja]|nr:hypothetical protein glysoja_017947 [Glycine soja]